MSEKKDWKLFQEKLPLWQERYMARLNQKYIAILEGEGMPSDKFHALDQEIRKDRRTAGGIGGAFQRYDVS